MSDFNRYLVKEGLTLPESKALTKSANRYMAQPDTISQPQQHEGRQMLNPTMRDYAEFGLGFTPAGVAIDANDIYKGFREGSPLMVAGGAIGLVPGVGDVMKGAFKKIRSSGLLDAMTDRARKNLRYAELGMESSVRSGDADKFNRYVRQWEEVTGKKIDTPDANGIQYDYRVDHKPSLDGSGAPLYDLSENGVYPKDVYDYRYQRDYGTGDSRLDNEAIDVINSVKGDPEATVTIFRAVPGVDSKADPRISKLTRLVKNLKAGKVKPFHDDLFNEFYNPVFKDYQNDLINSGDMNDLTIKSMTEEIANLKRKKQGGITDINDGDWVSISKKYAKDHGESALNGDYRILKEKVKAKDLFTSGDSWLEFGVRK